MARGLTAVATERGPALVGYAYLLPGDLHRAEDPVQEALARTFARPRTAQTSSSSRRMCGA